MSNAEKDEDMICGLTADERSVLQHELRSLPEVMPPRAVWHQIREQAEAEGLIRGNAARRYASWVGSAGLAAAVVLAVLVVPRLNAPEPASQVVPMITEQSNQVPLTALQALMVESQQLESDLRAMPEEPRVMRAGTVATLSEVEDRIAAIDYQLNDPAVQMTAEEKELFWRERVRLMKSLVQLRYAQTQRASF
jgi:hypothetical protein